eukprot:166706_1
MMNTEQPPKPEIVIQSPQTSHVTKPQDDYEPLGTCCCCIPIAFGVKFVVVLCGLGGLLFLYWYFSAGLPGLSGEPIYLIAGVLTLVCAVLGSIGIRKSDPQAITRFQVVYMISQVVNAVLPFFVDVPDPKTIDIDVSTGKLTFEFMTVGTKILNGSVSVLLHLYVVYVFNQYKKSLK